MNYNSQSNPRLNTILCFFIIANITTACSSADSVNESISNTQPSESLDNSSDKSSPTPTPSAIESKIPPEDDLSTTLTSKIEIKFANPMDETTLTEENITIMDQNKAVDGTVSYNSILKTAIFSPLTPFLEGVRYTVTLSTNIKDAAGIPLTDPISWNYTTGIFQSYFILSNPINGTISSYSINHDTGVLSLISNQVSIGLNISDISTVKNSAGTFLYIKSSSIDVNAEDNVIYISSINEDTGELTPLPSFTKSIGSYFNAIAIDPTGQFLYVANSEIHKVIGFTINSDGSLTSLSSASVTRDDSEPNSVTIHPSGKFLYIEESGLGSIALYSISDTGSLSFIEATPTLGGVAGVMIHPNGTFLYALDDSNYKISQFSIDLTSGKLSALTPASFPIPPGSAALQLDSLGKFIYFVSNTEPPVTIHTYEVTIDGNLSQASTFETIYTVNTPLGGVIHPSDTYYYMFNLFAGTVDTFSIDRGTGRLTLVPSLALDTNGTISGGALLRGTFK
jgi:6-phosphogluconolactonase (cycloisomerase 2 family)